MISEERAQHLARKYQSKVHFIRRLAEYSAAVAAGANRWDTLRRLGITAEASERRYRLWEERLRDELAAARTDDTPNDEGDEQ